MPLSNITRSQQFSWTRPIEGNGGSRLAREALQAHIRKCEKISSEMCRILDMPDAAHSFVRERVRLLAVALTPLVVVLLFLCIVPSGPKASSSSTASAAFSSTDQPVPSHSSTQKSLAKVLIDYPEEGSIFPPGITPPTFLWRDGASSNAWEITVSFADHSPAVHALSHGQRMQIGDIDPRCVAPTNEPPKLTPKEAEAWTWKPDDATWKAIQQHSVNRPAVFTVTGLRDGKAHCIHDFDRSGGRAYLLSRRSADAGRECGWSDPAAAEQCDPPDQVAAARHSRAGEPHHADRCADVPELPLVLGRRQDDGDRPRRAEQRQRALRDCADREAHLHYR